MIERRSQSYFQRRAEQERAAADEAVSELAARVHREMAERYSKLALEDDTPENPLIAAGGAGTPRRSLQLVP
jgi:hypothetical protein